MPTNELSFNQVATILNAVQQQATGQTSIAPTNTADFVTVATTLLKTGYDPVMNAINQVLTRTIFSIRPYERKFGSLEVSESAYGNHVRKLAIADKPVSEDDRYKWPVAYDSQQNPADGDGVATNPFVVRKPKILQTNFYGQNVFSDSYTVFRDQLDNAFTGPQQFGDFVGMVIQNMSNKLENVRENIARATVANFIGGIIDEGNAQRVVHLLTEYNTATGLSLTATTVMQPANYRAFVQWAFARIFTVSQMMTERTTMYQTIINGLPIVRHTPMATQKMLVYAPAEYAMQMMALSNTYHDQLVKLGAHETVNFWQSASTPDTINVTPSRVGANGTVVTAESAVNQAGVFAVLFDEEAMGYATTQQWSAPTPFESRHGFVTTWIHETERNWNDHSEKGVVFLMD